MARRWVDLHTHSTASDGQIRPARLMELADAQHLAAIALTDHDTVEGLAEARVAAERFAQLTLVPGIEVSASYPSGTLHILGLGIDPQAEAIDQLAQTLRAARAARNPKVIARLQQLGLEIDMDDVLAVVPDAAARGGKSVVSRLHIAEALRRKGLVSSTQQAFARYLNAGRPAYLDKERLPAERVIQAIGQAGGLAVLAHPVQLRCRNRLQLETVVRRLVSAGLGGIEIYHSDHDDVRTRQYLDLARELDLQITGGSDFHGAAKPEVALGHPRVPASVLQGPLARYRPGGPAG